MSLYLCSKKAYKVNGEIITIDGGLHATSSLYINWSDSLKMNAKLASDREKPLSKISTWIDKKIQKFKDPKKNNKWFKTVIGDSNWYTNLADAHYKITENYNKIDGEDNVLGALGQLKDVNGHIFTVENPKSARYIEDATPEKKQTKRPLGSQSVDLHLIGRLKDFATKK